VPANYEAASLGNSYGDGSLTVPPVGNRDSPLTWEALPLEAGYSSGRSDLADEFYRPCLSLASRYDRAVGYFRSSFFALLGVAVSDFVLGDGKIRLICSPSLTAVDLDAIERGLSLREAIDASLRGELQALIARPENLPVVRLLATLVGLGSLHVKIAYKPGSSGIFHDKVGVFADDSGPKASFVGSSNETYAAWDVDGNHEVIEVFRSWLSDEESVRVARHAEYFEDLWSGQEPGLIVADLPDVPRAELLRWQDDRGLRPALRAVRQLVQAEPELPAPESRRQLMPHQEQAAREWWRNQRGIVSHATGAGKTLTAIDIARRWLAERGPVLIIVPGDLLFRQWRDELGVELRGTGPAVLEAGADASRTDWRGALPDFTRDLGELGPRVTLATLQTAASLEFLSRVQGGSHLLVIADEVHRVGSPRNSNVTRMETGGRLGLSATPERFGDAFGTRLIFDYFGPVLEPAFGISEAIEVGRLVPYDYFIDLVPLEQGEAERWNALTEQIRRSAGRLRTRDDEPMPDALRMLLIRRARIVKQAAAKSRVAVQVIEANFKSDQSWLVYCDSQEQLGAVLSGLRAKGFDASEYHSSMQGSRPETMRFFRDKGGILVAIRCLDEGIDIPTVTHALILASSSNQREYIQRRGRVLRRAPGKYSAAIYDVLVSIEREGRQSVIDADLSRAAAFARLARNESIRQALAALARRTRASGFGDFESEEEGEQA
jgi:superfamily II DNA or RNA helicase